MLELPIQTSPPLSSLSPSGLEQTLHPLPALALHFLKERLQHPLMTGNFERPRFAHPVELLAQGAGNMEGKPHILRSLWLGLRCAATFTEVVLKRRVLWQCPLERWVVLWFTSDRHTHLDSIPSRCLYSTKIVSNLYGFRIKNVLIQCPNFCQGLGVSGLILRHRISAAKRVAECLAVAHGRIHVGPVVCVLLEQGRGRGIVSAPGEGLVDHGIGTQARIECARFLEQRYHGVSRPQVHRGGG